MSILPVDQQIMVQKSAEVGRINHNESNRPETAQQQFLEKLQREAQRQEQDVTQANKTEEQNINKDGKGPGGEGGRKRKKGKAERNKEDEQKIKGTSVFDVTV